MATIAAASRFYGIWGALTLVFFVSANEWHFPSCIVVDPDSYECLDSFYFYFGGYTSAVADGGEVDHTWVRYLDYIYDYDDASSTNCNVRRQEASKESWTNVSWTRNGFSICTEDEVTTFNTWWRQQCDGICVEDNNCRRYASFLSYHLWNNCSWDAETERPNYDVVVP